MGGIKGDVVFSQPQDNGPTTVMVSLTGINETLTWNIHQLPMIYHGNAAMSCDVGAVFDPKMAKESPNYNANCLFSSTARFDSCAVGDLAKMLGNLSRNAAQQNYTNQQLMIPITGPYSIMGRTLVLYSGNTAKACALITPAESMKTAVAVFKFPVAGFVYLRQVSENSDTSVFVDLFFVDNAESASQFSWQINQGVVSDDASDPSLYCKNVGEMFNPKVIEDDNCNQTMHDNCAIGDLTSKHGNVSVSVATAMQSSTKMAFTDTNLPLNGGSSVVGESIVLFSDKDAEIPVACAKIVHLEPKTLEVPFNADDNKGVDGYFKFTQSSPFDPTTTEIKLRGLQNKAEGYHVHAYPSPSYKPIAPSKACEALIAGDHWNPFNIDINTSPAAGTGTDDEYEVGDLSGKYGSFLNLTTYNESHTDYNLPLFGVNSIQGRSVVIHLQKIKDGNKRWVCNNLKAVNVQQTTFVMKATANFTGPKLTGVVLVDQYFSSKPNTAGEETSIYIDITYTEDSSTETTGHKWDVHDSPVGGDARAADLNKRCLSLNGNFNPYRVNTQGSYSTACKSTNMLRCESGDLTGKHTTFEVGGGRQFFNDLNLPLFGRNSGNDNTLTNIIFSFSLSFSWPRFDIILVSDQIYEVLSGLVSRWPIQACTRYALWEARWQNTWRVDHLDQGVRAPSPRHNMSFILPVIGRGIAVNDKDGGNGRLGCATITADSSRFVEKSLEYKTENGFSSAHFVDIMSKALQIPKWRLFNIWTEEGDEEGCLIVKFGIIGTADQSKQPVELFDDILSNRPEDLNEYRPSKDCDPKTTGSGGHLVNSFLLVAVAIVTSAMKGLRLI